MHLSHVKQPNRDEDAHNDADGEHPEHDFCPLASFKGVAGHLSMAERQILYDTINVGWSEERGLSQ